MRRAEDAAGLVALLEDEIRRKNRAFWVCAGLAALCALVFGYVLLTGW
jgi:hypothetical protein